MCYGTSSGRLSQLFHFGPLIAIFLITFITVTGFQCLLQWWPPNDLAGMIHIAIYLTWPVIIFHNYFRAVYLGPGFVPMNWRPENKEDEAKLQFCKICNAFKAPRSHHCKKCNRCVFKMDHHCPWINTCCGHKNHASFVYFLLFAPLGCIHASLVLGPTIYRAIFRNYYVFYGIKDVPIINLSFSGLVCCMFATGMAFGVAIAVGILFVIQMKSIIRNQTGIENWIVQKAIHRRKHFNIPGNFVYPYNLGRKENLHQVFNWRGDLRPIGDGFWWNVRDGCDQFTLTVEQLSQKEEKRVHSVRYVATQDYRGSLFPVSLGCKVACCFPWTDDPRMPVKVNDVIMVTRWQEHWVYGEKVVPTSTNGEANGNGEAKPVGKKPLNKGWFPVKCARYDGEPLNKSSKEDLEQLANSPSNQNGTVVESKQTNNKPNAKTKKIN